MRKAPAGGEVASALPRTLTSKRGVAITHNLDVVAAHGRLKSLKLKL